MRSTRRLVLASSWRGRDAQPGAPDSRRRASQVYSYVSGRRSLSRHVRPFHVVSQFVQQRGFAQVPFLALAGEFVPPPVQAWFRVFFFPQRPRHPSQHPRGCPQVTDVDCGGRDSSSTRRCSESEPADSLRDKSSVSGGWLRSLTLSLGNKTRE
jgi:hypothetical protein